MLYRCDGGTERRLVECNPALRVILPLTSREISNNSRRSRSIFAVLQNFLCLFVLVLLVHCVYPPASYYPHMPIGKVWIYRLLFCLFVLVCLYFVRLRIFPPRIKLAASNFARWFISVLGRESPILVNYHDFLLFLVCDKNS